MKAPCCLRAWHSPACINQALILMWSRLFSFPWTHAGSCNYLGIEHVLIIVHHDICKCQHVAGQKVGATSPFLQTIFSHVLQCVPAWNFQLLLPLVFQTPTCQTWSLMLTICFVRKSFCCSCMSPAAPRQPEQTRPG